MDCTHCESVLLDLCYGELPPAQEREARAHILDCPTCRKALSRLEAGQVAARYLPDDQPSAELTQKILRAAESHARRSTGGWLERVQLVIESMARIAMTRQVAMATLSLLIVFVGLWSIPELTRRREAHTEVVVEPSPTGEAGPSRPQLAQPSSTPAAAEPESPALDQAIAKNASGRARAKDAASSKGAAAAKPATEVAAKRRARITSDDLVAEQKQPKAAAPRKVSGRFAEPPPEPADKLARAPAPALTEPSVQGQGASTETTAARGKAESARDEAERSPAGLGAASEPPEAVPSASSTAPITLEDVFKAGVERYRAEDYAAAAQLFARMLESSAPSAQRAAALLYLARSERSLGRCDRAIRAYETLVRSYGSAQQSASALTEGVACYDQLSDGAGAARLLDHASSVPSLSVQATKMREDRGAAKPEAAPASKRP